MTEIHVTDDHIFDGVPRSCSACPVARAINGVLQPDLRANVASGVVSIYGPTGRLTTICLPPEVTGFIRTFDASPQLARPMSFPLGISDRFIRPSKTTPPETAQMPT